MKIVEEFRKFIIRGNLMDMAIGFTVGAAFTTVAKSLVNDIVMPPIGLLTGGTDFADKFWVLKEGSEASAPYATLAKAQEAGAVTMNYGVFLNNMLALLLVAIVIFVLIRIVNRLQDSLEEDPAPDTEPTEKKCRFCREAVAYEATRCRYCTSELPPRQPAPGPTG